VVRRYVDANPLQKPETVDNRGKDQPVALGSTGSFRDETFGPRFPHAFTRWLGGKQAFKRCNLFRRSSDRANHTQVVMMGWQQGCIEERVNFPLLTVD
jgi:hypothetical protein